MKRLTLLGSLRRVLVWWLCCVSGLTWAASFTLEVDAPLEINALLVKHSDLGRLQKEADLTDFDIERAVAQAHSNITQLLATQGYFSPTIEIDFDPGKKLVKVQVEPNQAAKIRSLVIQLDGAIGELDDTLLQRAQVSQAARQIRDESFSQAMWDEAKAATLTTLLRERFPAAQLVESQAQVQLGKQDVVDLRLRFDSGPEFRYGELNIQGIKRYSPDIVRNLNTAQPGQIYSLTGLAQTQERLTRSGFFDSVNVWVNNESDTPGQAPVNVEVVEAKAQKTILGLGVGSDYGKQISLEYQHHWLPGIQWQGNFKYSHDDLRDGLSATLLSPPDSNVRRWLLGAEQAKTSSNGTVSKTNNARFGFQSDDGKIDRRYYLLLDEGRISSSTKTQFAKLLLLNWSWHYTDLDSLQRPTAGQVVYTELGAGRGAIGNTDRLDLVLRGYFRGVLLRPLGPGRVQARGEYGLVKANTSVSIPQDQLFLAGGVNSIRGYAPRSIGVDFGDGTVVGGRQLTLYSLEYQYPVIPNWEASVFVDSGKVSDNLALNRWYTGLGTGLRWLSPLGPVQIDLAYGVQPQKVRLHLNIGFVF